MGGCLADDLSIKDTEKHNLARQVNFMIMIEKERNLRDEYISKIYEEWIQIANRLQTGGKMIYEAMKNKRPEALKGDNRFQNLVNLYQFLMSVLGIYDGFMKKNLHESHYISMRDQVLEILRE